MSSSLDDRIRDLLAAPPADFVSARSAAARELKASGDAAAASELAALRKPPLRVWAANRAAQSRADSARRLADATARLRDAERRVAMGERGLGAALREAAVEQRRQLEVLEAEARRLLEDAGAAASAAGEAREILRVAVREGGAAWRRLASGTLLEEPVAEDDSVFALAAADLPSRPPDRRDQAEQRRLVRVEAAARDARAQAIALDRAARDLEDRARAARRRADAAAAQADEAEAELRRVSRPR